MREKWDTLYKSWLRYKYYIAPRSSDLTADLSRLLNASALWMNANELCESRF